MLSRLSSVSGRLAVRSQKQLATRVAVVKVPSRSISHIVDKQLDHIKDCKCPYCVPNAPAQSEEGITFYANSTVDPSVWTTYTKDLNAEETTALYKVDEEFREPVYVDGRDVTTLGSIISKFGVWPFVGSIAVILHAKEFLPVTFHYVYYVGFPIFAFGGYLATADVFWKSCVDEVKEETKFWNDWNSLMVDGALISLKDAESNKLTPGVLREAKNQYNEAAKKLYEFKTWELKKKHHDDILNKLKAVKTRQEMEQARLAEANRVDINDYFRKKFGTATQADKDQVLELALKRFETGNLDLTPAANPVSRIFVQFCKDHPDQAPKVQL